MEKPLKNHWILLLKKKNMLLKLTLLIMANFASFLKPVIPNIKKRDLKKYLKYRALFNNAFFT